MALSKLFTMRDQYPTSRWSYLRFRILLLILAIYQLPLPGQTNFAIRKIVFKGNRTFADESLKEKISLYSCSKLQSLLFLKKPFIFNEEILKNDVERLTRFYQSEGFLNIAIAHDLESNDKKQTVTIVFKISEGEPIRVRQVQYKFPVDRRSSELDSVNMLIGKFTPMLKRDARFRDQALLTDQEKITRNFSNAGYPYFDMQPKLSLRTESHAVDVEYNVRLGPRCFFGVISIEENKKTQSSIIRKQLAFRTGEVFKQELIEKSQLQVYQLGFFQTVMIRSLMGTGEMNSIPIQVVVKEAPRFTVKFGFGYGKEENIRVFSDVRLLSFLGGARRLNFTVKHSGLEPYHLNLKMTQPAFITPRTTFLINSFLRQEDEPGFKVNRIGANFSLQQQITPTANGHISYNLEQDNLDISLAARDQQANSPDMKLYNKSSIIIAFLRDTSRPLFSPRQGSFGALTYTVTLPFLRNDFHFTRLLFEIRRYLVLAERGVFAIKAKLGAMQPILGDAVIPIEERFFAGGSMSIRGWTRAQISPENSAGAPIGGNSYFEGSAEVRLPIVGVFSGAVFLDLGNVWRETLFYNFRDLRSAAGLGLRIETPIGPIRLDLARPIFDQDKFVRVHLSVGQAF